MLSRMARPAEALKALDKILDRVHSEGDRSAHYAAQIQRADALIQLHRLNDAQAALNEAAAAASSGVGGSPAFSAAIEALLAQLEMTRGALQSAHQHLDRALKLAGYRTDKPERTLAKALLIGARVRLAEGAGPESERFAREALAINEGVARGPDTSANVGEALLRLAQARIKQGKTSGVRSLLNRAVKCLTNGLDANHPLTVEARTLLAATGP
jgi:tetratricopeptide (TPR) repeat protein